MKLIYPISTHDFHLLEPQIRLEEHLNGLRGFEVVLAPSSNVRAQLMASGYVERFQSITRSTTILETNHVETGSWPSGPNRHWARTAIALDQAGVGEAWFWKELDCWSVVSNWALRIAEDYLHGKKPFMGCIVNTPFADKQTRPDDLMMMGCAVYRHDLSSNWEFRPILESLINGVSITASSAAREDPWDIMARGSFRKWGWTATDLIGDRWNTKNYRTNGPDLLFDEGESKFNNIEHKRTDITKAVVIHGCKDDSLAKLVMSGEYDAYLTAAKLSGSRSTQKGPPAPITPKDALEALAGRFVTDEEHKRFQEALEKMMGPTLNPSFEEMIRLCEEQSKEREKSTLEIPSALMGKVESIIASHNNIRAGKLAEMTGMEKDEMIRLLEANGYTVMPKLQWVKKKV